MKALNFERFVFEQSVDLPPEVKLAKMGLSPGIRVFEWWTEAKAEDPAFLTIFFIERYAWPESSEDDVIVETHFSMERSRDYIEERLMRFAQDHDMDWIHDMELDTWKKVNR
jgi:hypothetical protein